MDRTQGKVSWHSPKRDALELRTGGVPAAGVRPVVQHGRAPTRGHHGLVGRHEPSRKLGVGKVPVVLQGGSHSYGRTDGQTLEGGGV